MKCSCIIPAFGRDVNVVEETLLSLFSLEEEFFSNCTQIFLIDQNITPLKIDLKLATWPKKYLERIDYTLYCGKCKSVQLNLENSENSENSNNKIKFLHIISLPPSTTIAKNYAIALAEGELLLFFDDDVLIQKGTIDSHIKIQQEYSNAGFVCGREIIDPPERGRSNFREFLAALMENFISNEKKRLQESEYIAERYVGRVTKQSFFLCDFNQDINGNGNGNGNRNGNRVIKINTIRGCNASLKRAIFEKSGGFDENFQGTALREESDLCLRLEKMGYTNYYTDKALVIHRRQLGGCNNLSKSYTSLISKYECELLFQSKHFKDKSFIFFFIRLLPLTMENFIRTWGISAILLLQFVYAFFKLQRH
ncbi:MAG: hypothetical protein HQK49_14560 [Oligoflexia bacterium]|nr:hypothetical protein [Oligoflexia bacterium]